MITFSFGTRTRKPSRNARTFLGAVLALALLSAAPLTRPHEPGRAGHPLPEMHHGHRAAEHPEPRAGITAAKVVPRERLLERGRHEEAIVYDMVRAIPAIADGLYCYCHCAKHNGHRSLLTCFESGHGANCDTCMAEARLAHRLHREGKTLHDIRAAVDAEFGS